MTKNVKGVEIPDIKVTLDNYQELAHRTQKMMPDTIQDTVHMTLGVIGEYGELQKAIANKDNKNIREEVGDITWYVANDCNNHGLSFKEITTDAWNTMSEQETFDAADYDVFGYVDFVKKVYVYGAELNTKLLRRYLVNIMRMVINETYWRGDDFSLETLLQINIDKLMVRFGDKYSDYNALNRDTTKEEKTFGEA